MKKVICDTNIWYGLGSGELQKPSGVKLVATWVNVDEFSRTPNLLKNSELVRAGIRASMKQQDLLYQYPPIIHVKKLDEPDFFYDTFAIDGQRFEFTRRIAKGEEVTPEFARHIQECLKPLETFAMEVNKILTLIQARRIDPATHRLETSSEDYRELLQRFLTVLTKDAGLSNDFEWGKIELWENVTRFWFEELELKRRADNNSGKTKVEANDLLDWMQLLYVQPGDLYWTQEKKWNRWIEEAGLGQYVFKGACMAS